MLIKLDRDDWSAPVPVHGPVMIQARTDGAIFVAWSQDGALPEGPTDGLRLRDGDREFLGFVVDQTLRLRRSEGTAIAELFVGPWISNG